MKKNNTALENVIVYKEPGRFGGWPANHGIWGWGNEILVGFERAYYQSNDKGHSIIPGKPSEPGLARSLDGGVTWSLEEPGELARGFGNPLPCLDEVQFDHPDFAMKCDGSGFFISYDRGKSWRGPYEIPDFGRKLTSRTDYLVSGTKECLFFISAFEPKVEAGIRDRAFCARTKDGARSFEFLSWMTNEPISIRSVMPSTIRGAQDQLISAMRRRHDTHSGGVVTPSCWIDVYQSLDGGQSWHFLSKVADTGDWNGNPPSRVRLKDGRLCVAYGYRRIPFGIRARLSDDEGQSWEEEIILRNDGRTWDLGYSRMVQRPDGKLVTVYYYTTDRDREQHIAATIWDPGLPSVKIEPGTYQHE
jgi:hypothetical protein